jgi:hypothetical protein
VTIRRWQKLTGEQARHAETGFAFDEVAQSRSLPPVRHRARPALIPAEGDRDAR